MADGLNDARAIRIAEIMTDFRNLQHYIARIRASPSAEEYYLEGYALLRQCAAEAQAVLVAPYAASPTGGDLEMQRAQLRAVLLDASIRRFQCQKLYLQATAAMRWINSRNNVLGGDSPQAGHMPALQGIDVALRTELGAITDEYVDYSLRSQDVSQAKWLDEDPTLRQIQQYLRC
ncbi:hypothetical protein K490DRAFT_72066 [Saccharata proteae CBS 121410]|uniref:Uncharacterized protein n=1 Tax=Saccharata proteae CBS 121410 TaxID=1314787 RepID=A0A6A5YBK1_9PEZI|nr:hypothetical protein K490DRAFT_72066 [Saccharata proteae CBS 121410]